MKKPLLFITLISLTISSYCQNLSISKDVPTENSEAYFDVYFEVSLDMSIMYGTIYFDVSEKGGVQSMEIRSDYDFDDSDTYPPGSSLHYSGGGDNTITSDYWLASAWNEGYDGYETLKVKVRVTPNQSGDINLYYRATYINGITEVRKPSYSSYMDQQFWYCNKVTILNKPDKLPNVYVKDIEVNGGNTVYQGDRVKISVVIKEDNGVDAGEVGINYFVNNSPVDETDDPDDYTSSLEAYDEDSESVYHTFNTLGTNQIRVIVDPYDNLPEEDEDDNIKYHTINVIKKNEKPTITITEGPNNNETIDYDDVTFSWSGADSDGTVNGYQYEFDGNGYSTAYTTKTFNSLSEGGHTFKVRCSDDDGDYSDWKQIDFTIALNKKPTITITEGPNNNETIDYDDVTFSWSGADSDGTVNGYQYEFDGNGNSTAYTTKTFNSLSEGEHTFKVRCSDDDGGYSDWSICIFYVRLQKDRTIVFKDEIFDTPVVDFNYKLYYDGMFLKQANNVSEIQINNTGEYEIYIVNDFYEDFIDFSVSTQTIEELTLFPSRKELTYDDFSESTLKDFSISQSYGFIVASILDEKIQEVRIGDYISQTFSNLELGNPETWKEAGNTEAGILKKSLKFPKKDFGDYIISGGYYYKKYDKIDDFTIEPFVFIDSKNTGITYHIVNDGITIEHIGNHRKIGKFKIFNSQYTPETSFLGQVVELETVNGKQQISTFAKIKDVTPTHELLMQLDNADNFNFDFDIRTLKAIGDETGGFGWKTSNNGALKAKNYAIDFYKSEGFNNQIIFDSSLRPKVSSLKQLKYIKNAGRALKFVGIAGTIVSVADIGYSFVQGDIQAGVCKATATATSSGVGVATIWAGTATCAYISSPTVIGPVACGAVGLIAAGVASYFTYEATDELCNENWDKITMTLDNLFNQQIEYKKEEILLVKDILIEEGYPKPQEPIADDNSIIEYSNVDYNISQISLSIPNQNVSNSDTILFSMGYNEDIELPNTSNIVCLVRLEPSGTTFENNPLLTINYNDTISSLVDKGKLALYYLKSDSTFEKIESINNVNNNSISAYLEHFSSYVLGEDKEATTISEIEYTPKTYFNIYPNPATSCFTIQTNLSNAHLYAYNSLGELVMDMKINQNEKTFEIENTIKRGIYILRLVSPTESLARKIIIN